MLTEMMRKRLLIYISGIIFLAVMVVIALMLVYGVSFAKDYRVPLPNGYELVEVSGSTIGIGCHGTIVVLPDVDGYRVMQSVIVGHTSIADHQLLESRPGYFIIETASGKAHDGLKKTVWLSILRKRNVQNTPELHRPSRFDSVFGHNRPADAR